MPIPLTCDNSPQPPRLETFLNAGTLVNLPKTTSFPNGTITSEYSAIREAGFTGLQDGDYQIAKQVGLKIAAGARVNAPQEIEPLVEAHLSQGQLATTLHCGWGMESDKEIDAYLRTILEVSEKYAYPLFLETHRATITQDNWRTVQLVERFPDIRFNGDFSHWYAGLEMVNGNWEEKIEFIRPILERVRFLHGRIADPGCIQIPLHLQPEAPYFDHFRQIWRLCFEGFLREAKDGDFIIFAPELLWPEIYYARVDRDPDQNIVEVGDRWKDSLLIMEMAKQEFSNAIAATSLH